jgi:hypothetical protein
MIASRGRGVALQYGFRLKGDWYGTPKLASWAAAIACLVHYLDHPAADERVVFVRSD